MAQIKYQHDPINRSTCNWDLAKADEPFNLCGKPSEYKVMRNPETGLRERAYAGLCSYHCYLVLQRPEEDEDDE